MAESRAAAREALRGLLRTERNTYAGADQANATRIVAALWLLSGALTLAFFPFDPPTAEIGGPGWAAAGLVVIASLLVGRSLLRRSSPPRFDALLLLGYAGLAQVTLVQWLAGGAESAYSLLYLLWIGAAMGIHPARRALTFLIVALVAAASPLVYDGWSSAAASEIVTEVLLWTALGLIMLALMTNVRFQRVTMRDAEEHARQLAQADQLTGIGNRRAFDEALGAEIARTTRAGSPLSIAMLDVDDFKELNDRFGHLEGDRCLRQVARAIGEATRGGDRGFRWGGDEFVLLLPDTSLDGAEQAVQRIAAEIMQSCSAPDGRSLSVCFGLAELASGLTAGEMLAQADIGLMAHKRERARATRSETPHEP